VWIGDRGDVLAKERTEHLPAVFLCAIEFDIAGLVANEILLGELIVRLIVL